MLGACRFSVITAGNGFRTEGLEFRAERPRQGRERMRERSETPDPKPYKPLTLNRSNLNLRIELSRTKQTEADPQG